MQNWKHVALLFALLVFVSTVSVRNSSAQAPAGMIQQPGQAPNAAPPAQQPMPGTGQGQQVPNGGLAPNQVAPNQGQGPVAPMGQAPFPRLEPAYQQYLDDVLAKWEQSTGGITRYQCKFSRWQYNPTATKDPNAFETAGTGVIKYLAPDKGMFQVEELKFRKQKPDGTWGHEVIPGQYGEWWICDGESVHLYDQTQKIAKKYALPPNMRGAEVFNSPLPFVFGVKAEKVNARFWIRPLPPPALANGQPNENVILLEAYPKFQADAVNYHHVSIYLDRTQFLPLAIVISLPQWTPQQDHKEVFEFRDREVNAGLLAKINEAIFRQSFIPKEPPKGWTVEEVPFVPEEDGQRVAAPAGQQQNQLPR